LEHTWGSWRRNDELTRWVIGQAAAAPIVHMFVRVMGQASVRAWLGQGSDRGACGLKQAEAHELGRARACWAAVGARGARQDATGPSGRGVAGLGAERLCGMGRGTRGSGELELSRKLGGPVRAGRTGVERHVGQRWAGKQASQWGRKSWFGPGREGKGKAGLFLFLSYFFIFCSFLFSPRLQIKFLIKRMLHKITHSAK
jgi:hypothetical protein